MTSPVAVTVWCGFCGTGPDTPCTPDGQHFDRYLRAWPEGLISRKTVTGVCAVLGSVSAGALVPDALTPLQVGQPDPRHSWLTVACLCCRVPRTAWQMEATGRRHGFRPSVLIFGLALLACPDAR
jgi:hypothetical protein